MSVPTTRAPGCSSAIASAIAPDPVPMSSTAGSARSAISSRQRSTSTSVSGRGIENAGIDAQRQPAESPLPEHVRERLPRRAPRDELAEDALAIGRRLVAVRVQLGPRNAERVREQPLRVDARRRHPGAAELLGPGDQEVADGHSLEGAALVLGGQRLGELVEVALEDLVEPVLRQLDPVVGDAVLGEVVGADLLGALAGADLRRGGSRPARRAASLARAS